MKSFFEAEENVNANQKTLYELKLSNNFLSSEEERREIKEIPVTRLQALAIMFMLGVSKKNGKEYEPSSLRAFLQSVD